MWAGRLDSLAWWGHRGLCCTYLDATAKWCKYSWYPFCFVIQFTHKFFVLLLRTKMNKNNAAVNYSEDLCARAVRELADLTRQEHTVTQQRRRQTQLRRPFVLRRAACTHSHIEHKPRVLIGSGHQIWIENTLYNLLLRGNKAAGTCTRTHKRMHTNPHLLPFSPARPHWGLFILYMWERRDDVSRQKQGETKKKRGKWGWNDEERKKLHRPAEMRLQTQRRVGVSSVEVWNCGCVVSGKIWAFKKGPWLSICARCLLKEQTTCDGHKVRAVCPNICCGFLTHTVIMMDEGAETACRVSRRESGESEGVCFSQANVFHAGWWQRDFW